MNHRKNFFGSGFAKTNQFFCNSVWNAENSAFCPTDASQYFFFQINAIQTEKVWESIFHFTLFFTKMHQLQLSSLLHCWKTFQNLLASARLSSQFPFHEREYPFHKSNRFRRSSVVWAELRNPRFESVSCDPPGVRSRTEEHNVIVPLKYHLFVS